MIEVRVLHQPKQAQSFARAQIVLFLLELGNGFTVGINPVPFIEPVRLPGRFQNVSDFAGQFAFGDPFLVSCSKTVGNGQQNAVVVQPLDSGSLWRICFHPGDQMHVPRYQALAMHMRPLAHVDVVRWLYHPQIRQPPEPPTQPLDEPTNIDFFLLVRRAAAAVTQREQEDALIRLGLMWPEVKMIREFFTDHFPPSNPSPGTHRAHPTGIIVEQLQMMGTLKKG